MKAKICITSLVLAVLCLSFSTLARKQYCNNRFQFCMEYPEDFKADGESGNGDGQTFSARKGTAKIWAWGNLVMDPSELYDDVKPGTDPLQYKFKSAIEGIKVAYKVIKLNFYIFSGTNEKGDIVYCKTVKHKINYMGSADSEVFQTIMIIYPAAEQDKYKDYCSYIAGSLK
ncbi:hypothetical protein [Chitinophaga qingshengii]|uniref:Uncharacterized protein n=1 Tax=Chitinophaga qingshengii TaxID=1569794 RepID=A0ABR7TX63_9BACT|nr:hypothetical protein [Chitinophaga qingshengii]MBC9935027.1 hypothetical protein [Chitinophaga qingshengii]